MKIDPVSPALGARITGIDLSKDLSSEAFEAIHRAWLDHLVLIFPDQDLTEEEQVRFARLWGEFPVRDRYDKRAEKDTADKSIMLVSNVRDKDGKPIGSLPDGEMMFHSDGAYDRHPYRYTMLYAVELPSTGGNTVFANLYKAYEALPDDLKAKLAHCTAHQEYYAGTVIKGENVGHINGVFDHPVFTAHEETGEPVLFVSRLITMGIPELPEDEQAEILEFLFDHTEKPEFIYEHVWSPGDFVMWDNRCTNHARTDFPRVERRLLRRNVIQGVQPERAAV